MPGSEKQQPRAVPIKGAAWDCFCLCGKYKKGTKLSQKLLIPRPQISCPRPCGYHTSVGSGQCFAAGYKCPQDGALLKVFSANIGDDSARIAYKNGSPNIWWLRSAVTQNTTNAYIISVKGGGGGYGATTQYGIRPALVLPSNATVDANMNVIASGT